MNLIEIAFKSTLKSMIIHKITFNDFNFINKEYKLVNHKKNI